MILLATLFACDLPEVNSASSTTDTGSDILDNLGGQEGEAGGGGLHEIEYPEFSGGSTVDPGFIGSTACDNAGTLPSTAAVCSGPAKVWFTEADGTLVDYTADFSAGTIDDPAKIQLKTPGTMTICGGTWHAYVYGTDIDIVAPDGPEATVLESGIHERPFSFHGTSSVSGLTLQKSEALYATGDLTVTNSCFTDGEGGIWFEGSGTLTIEDSAFVGNVAAAGAIMIREGKLVGERLHFSGNDAIFGILYITQGVDVDISEASFDDNYGYFEGRGVFYVSQTSTVALRNSRFANNTSAIWSAGYSTFQIDNVLFNGQGNTFHSALNFNGGDHTEVSRSSFIGNDRAVDVYRATFIAEDSLFWGNASDRGQGHRI